MAAPEGLSGLPQADDAKVELALQYLAHGLIGHFQSGVLGAQSAAPHFTGQRVDRNAACCVEIERLAHQWRCRGINLLRLAPTIKVSKRCGQRIDALFEPSVEPLL